MGERGRDGVMYIHVPFTSAKLMAFHALCFGSSCRVESFTRRAFPSVPAFMALSASTGYAFLSAHPKMTA